MADQPIQPGQTKCAVNPSPHYASTTYTIFSPGQSVTPPDYTPGWTTRYPVNQIAWEPNPCAPVCLSKAGITSYDQWIDWFYCQVIRLFCDWANSPCKMLVGGKLTSVGDTLATCLGMTTTKNTIVYDTTEKIAIAGALINDADCNIWMDAAFTCIKNADSTDPSPTRVLGRKAGDIAKPYWFTIKTQPLTTIIHNFQLAKPQNVYTNTLSGSRLIPLATAPLLTAPNEGNSYFDVSGKLYIDKDGFYRFSCQTFVDLTYTLKTGKDGYFTVIAGFVTEAPTTFALAEFRAFQTPIWREHLVTQRTHVKWHHAMFLKAGTKITPRIWVGVEANDGINVNLVSYDKNSQITLFRIADRTIN